jgi:hypothetical protein
MKLQKNMGATLGAFVMSAIPLLSISHNALACDPLTEHCDDFSTRFEKPAPYDPFGTTFGTTPDRKAPWDVSKDTKTGNVYWGKTDRKQGDNSSYYVPAAAVINPLGASGPMQILGQAEDVPVPPPTELSSQLLAAVEVDCKMNTSTEAAVYKPYFMTLASVSDNTDPEALPWLNGLFYVTVGKEDFGGSPILPRPEQTIFPGERLGAFVQYRIATFRLRYVNYQTWPFEMRQQDIQMVYPVSTYIGAC